MENVIEINGVKFEVDVTKLRRIQEFKTGDAVKVLVKDYSSWKSYPGIVIGIDPFHNLPTVCIAYLDITYSTCALKFAYLNSEAKDVEVTAIGEGDFVAIEKSRVLEILDNDIQKKELELQEARQKKDHIERRFDSLFRESLSPEQRAN